MIILGIAAYYHDSSACLIKDGHILCAFQEERLSRLKHDPRFPRLAIQECLKIANLRPDEIEAVVFYEKPFLKFERLLETYLQFAPRGFKSFLTSMPLWLKEKLYQKKEMKRELLGLGFSDEHLEKFYFSDHHLSHAASAFYPSPFKEAIVLTMDGVGEWTTTSVYIGKENKLKLERTILFPHSLGLLYSAFTTYCGFKVNSGEYKLMGLAPYGRPLYADVIKENLIHIHEDGSYVLNMDFFDYCTGLSMTNDRFDKLFGNHKRLPETPLEQVHKDLAASIQLVCEEVLLKIATDLKKTYQLENICLAGGVALNCVANGKLKKSGLFKNIWIQPAAGDSGGSLGAALAFYYQHLEKERIPKDGIDEMQGSYLGYSFSNDEIARFLIEKNIPHIRYNSKTLYSTVANELATGAAVGWFQGRMEFGPRALGNRSILADARIPTMQKDLNLKIKFRESFRPFAPAILEEESATYFPNLDHSPYMLLVDEFKTDEFPAVTHVDHSARVQTVSKNTNPEFHQLLSAFKEKTGCPILVNTSFNVRGEPIVASPEHALQCFLGTHLDVLVLGEFVILKKDIPQELLIDYKNNFEMD